MYANWVANAAVVIATLIAVSLAVLVHYEGLIYLSQHLRRTHGLQRIKVLYTILSVIALHVAEIWIFGAILWLLVQWPDCGHIGTGTNLAGQMGLLDAIYFSATTFTTLGYGDLAPVGPIRFLSGTAALTGLVLISWSASFTYLEMERCWRNP